LYVNAPHKDLPGNDAVKHQILNILNGQENVLAPGILASPAIDSDGWQWFSASPIRTHITDEEGHTNGLDTSGNLREKIEDSAHFLFPQNEGGFFPFDKTYTVNIDATDNGLFTLRFDHVGGEDAHVVDSTSYTQIPVSINSHGHLTLSPTSPAPALAIDIDGDGTVDFTVSANATPPANMFPAVLTDVVRSLGLPGDFAKSLLAKLSAAAASLKRGDTIAARGQLGAFLNEVSAQRSHLLSVGQADALITLARAAIGRL